MHDLPLVFFTVLSQAAIGLVLLSTFSYKYQNRAQPAHHHALTAAAVTMLLALIIGTFHLGHPFRALNVIFGLGRSPMSNEAMLSGLFLGILIIAILPQYLPFPKGARIQGWCYNLAPAIALIFAWSITRIYQIDTVATWATGYTTFYFLITSLIVGGVAATWLGMVSLGSGVFIIGVILSFMFKNNYLLYLHNLAPDLVTAQTSLWRFQSIFLAVALVLTCLNFHDLNGFKIKAGAIPLEIPVLSSIIIGMVLIAELLGRFAFYKLWMIPM